MIEHRFCWVFAVFLSISSALFAQEAKDDFVLSKTITTEEGLPINSVFSLKKAPDGLIWIGTMDGLVFSDGFQIIKKPAFEVPEVLQKGAFIRDIQRFGETMYVSSDDTAMMRNKNGWKGISSVFNARRIIHLGENWYELRPGVPELKPLVVTFTEDRFEIVDSLLKGETAVLADRGKLVILKSQGLFVSETDSIGIKNQRPLVFEGIGNQKFYGLWRFGEFGMLLFTQSLDGFLHVWEAELNGKTSHLSAHNPGEKFNKENLWLIPYPAKVHEAGGGLFWLMVENRTSFSVRLQKENSGLKVELAHFDSGFIRSMEAVSEQEIWTGRDTEGVFVLKRPMPFHRIETSTALLKSLFFGKNGQLAAITNAPAISLLHFDVEKKEMLSEKILLDRVGDAVSMKLDRFGDIVLSLGESHIEKRPFDLANNAVTRLFSFPIEAKNAVIIAPLADASIIVHEGILQKLDHRKSVLHPTELVFSSNEAGWNYEGFERNDSLWVNDELSLHLFDVRNERATSFSKPSFLKQRLRTISPDEVFPDRKLIWVGSTDGIAAFDRKAKQWIEIQTEREWPSTFIYGIIPHKKDLWISTNRGIVRFTPRFEGDKIVGPVRFFTKEDGLASTEFNSYSFAQREDGLIAFGGIGGITLFHPDSIPAASTLARPILTQVELFDQFFPVESGKVVELNSDQNQFRFHYSAVDASDPAKISFEVRLLGQEENWLKQEARRDVLFPAISPGKYAFQVRLTNEDGVVLPEETLYEFEILPPIWLRWWFLSLVGLMVLGGIILVVRIISTRQLRERIRELETEKRIRDERQKTRAQIARDLHDEVSSTLSAVAMLTSKAETSDDVTRGRIHEQLVEARSSMEEMIWNLSPRNDQLNKLVFRISDLINDYAAQAGILAEVRLPDEIPSVELKHETRKNLYLIFKEAITNAVKYSGGTLLVFEMKMVENVLELSLSDNGKGFVAKEQIPDGKNAKSKGGNGLLNMRERAETIGAALEINSGSGGTRIVLRRGIEIIGS